MVNVGYKFRIYPTKEQASILAMSFGCSRVVYNKALDFRTKSWYNDKTRVSYVDLSKQLTSWKKLDEYIWLNEVSSVCLQQELRHLDAAFTSFFKGNCKYPTFKKKSGKQSVTFASSAFTLDNNIPNIIFAKGLGKFKTKVNRKVKGQIKTITISKTPSNQYFMSFSTEQNSKPLKSTGNSVGVDLGVKDLVVLSSGSKYPNIKTTNKYQIKLAKAQKSLSRKNIGSKNRNKARLKVAKIYNKISNTRLDHQHKITTAIVKNHDIIAVETLNVKGMVKNHKLAKAISDCGWGEIVRQLEYKSQWYGRTLVKIDKWFPSSKMCSSCNYILNHLDLNTRQWKCPQCGKTHDRDINAACNILAAGQAVLANGDGVKPPRNKDFFNSKVVPISEVGTTSVV